MLIGIIWNLWLFSGIGSQIAANPLVRGCHFTRAYHHVGIHAWRGKRSDTVLCYQWERAALSWHEASPGDREAQP